MPATATTPRSARETYDRDGFTVVPQIMTLDELSDLHDATQRYIREELPRLPIDAAYYEDKNDPSTLFRLASLELYNPVFRNLLWSDTMRNLAAGLLGEPAAPRGVMMFGKAPKVGKQTPPHQDTYYWMIDPPGAGLTMWIPLDRADESNGCVHYAAGSHRDGLRPHGESKQFGFSFGLLDYGDRDRKREAPVPIDAGDLIAHNGLTVHRADPNLSDRRRWAIGLVYFGQSAVIDKERSRAHAEKIKAEWKASNAL